MKKVEENEKQDNNSPELEHQFTRMFKKIKRNTDICDTSKLILAEIISYQLQGQKFYMTDDGIAYEFGINAKKASRTIKKLKPYLNVEAIYVKPDTGGRPKQRRILTVKNLKDWVPYQVAKDIKVDVTKFKTIPEFMRWAYTVFETTDDVYAFSSYNKKVEKHLESISKAA